MPNPWNTKKNSTLGSAALLLLLGAATAVLAVFLAFNLQILENLMAIAVIILVVITIAALAVHAAAALLALPYYVAKGETYQTDGTYDLDDVKAVKEKDSGKDEGL